MAKEWLKSRWDSWAESYRVNEEDLATLLATARDEGMERAAVIADNYFALEVAQAIRSEKQR